MKAKIAAILLFTTLLGGCGSETSPGTTSPGGSASVDLNALPANVEGRLEVDVAEGDVDDGGYSEHNFGNLIAGSQEIPVEISAAILRSAGLSPEGTADVIATLGSKREQFGQTFYTVTSLRQP